MLISQYFDITASPTLSLQSTEKLLKEIHVFHERIFIKENNNCKQVGSCFETSPGLPPHVLEGTPSEAETLDLSKCRRLSGCCGYWKMKWPPEAWEGRWKEKKENFLKKTLAFQQDKTYTSVPLTRNSIAGCFLNSRICQSEKSCWNSV